MRRLGVDARGEVIRLLQIAQSGSPESALSASDAALAAIGTRTGPPPAPDFAPGLHYVRGIAHHCLGDHAAASLAAEQVVHTARANAVPAWVTIGQLLALLQQILSSGDLSTREGLLQDLACAEADLPGTAGEPFAAVTAFAGIGRCYLVLRLYEFAQPHFEAAVGVIAENSELLRVAAVTMQLNLAEMHASWAMELRRVARAAEAVEHESAGRQHAIQARDTPALEETSAYRDKARLLVSCLAGEDEDPLVVANRIRASSAELMGHGQRCDLSFALIFEARALSRAGELSAALSTVRQACAALPSDAPPALTAAVLHCRARMVADLGKDGEILAYGDHLALVLADQRERTVALARSVQLLERLRRERERIQQLAYTDGLTGVGNRHAFELYLSEREINERFQLALIDVDDLKLVNDRQGHAAGDEMLRVIARVLLARSGPRDFVVRLGGDEFVVVSAEQSDVSPDVVGAQIVAAVATAQLGGTVSVGVAAGAVVDVHDVLRRADQAMYVAKRQGRHDRRGTSAARFRPPGGWHAPGADVRAVVDSEPGGRSVGVGSGPPADTDSAVGTESAVSTESAVGTESASGIAAT